jgi:hypothetical protein
LHHRQELQKLRVTSVMDLIQLLNLDEQRLVEEVLELPMDEIQVVDLDVQDQQIIFDHVKQYD